MSVMGSQNSLPAEQQKRRAQCKNTAPAAATTTSLLVLHHSALLLFEASVPPSVLSLSPLRPSFNFQVFFYISVVVFCVYVCGGDAVKPRQPAGEQSVSALDVAK